MKKVLVFGITDNPGGIESVIMNYYRHFDKKSISLDFLCNTEIVAYEEEIKSLGGNIYKICARSKNYRQYKKNMIDFYKKNANKYDSIWVNVCSLANIDYLKYAKKYGIKKRIIHCHNSQNMDSFARGILHRINRIMIKKYATDFWSCSTEASQWFYNQKIINSKKYLLVNNAIDIKKFEYNPRIRDMIRKKLKVEDKVVFGNVGRLHFQKNQEFALQIFAKYTKNNPNSVFLLIGEGEDKDKLKELVKELKIRDKVKFLGIRKDINKLLQGMDVFLFPSKFEGLSLSLIEAQASGLLIFTSNTVSKESKMSNYIYFLDLNANIDTWVNKITKKIDNEKRKNRKHNISSSFDINVESKKIQDLL